MNKFNFEKSSAFWAFFVVFILTVSFIIALLTYDFFSRSSKEKANGPPQAAVTPPPKPLPEFTLKALASTEGCTVYKFDGKYSSARFFMACKNACAATAAPSNPS